MENQLLADYTFAAKYAKYDTSKGRRESYAEAVTRQMDMHRTRFPEHRDILDFVEQEMQAKRIVGSQRAMQFGGAAIYQKNMRIYNCSAMHIAYMHAFSHFHWLLLCGTGVGFSLQAHHIAQLPEIRRPSAARPFKVADSIEGWADATQALFESYFYGTSALVFDFSGIRPKGAPLTHGGKAPGPEPLKRALEKCNQILSNAVDMNTPRKLRSIEVYDCLMHLADSVVSGGIRRSACIALFDADDQEMLASKTGSWFVDNPQRGRANNSAVITPETPQEVFKALFNSTKEFGEPGFVFLENREYVLNPCAEVTMCPLLVTNADGEVVQRYTHDLLDYNKRSYWLSLGYRFYEGVQVCNLTEINMNNLRDVGDFYTSCTAAGALGTFQAAYTNFEYLGEISELIVRREALLGVSLTGMLSNDIFKSEQTLRTGAQLVNHINRVLAKDLGIQTASRTTLVKPSGTASIVLGTSAGIHPWHAPRYIRRVQADAYEDLYRFVESKQPERCFKSSWGGEHARYIAFACEAPEGAVTKSMLSAVEHLEMVRSVNQSWVRSGTQVDRLEGAHHNVSCTITVSPSEWASVADYLWENRRFFTGVSLLGSSGDYEYVEAPYQEVHSGPYSDKPEERAAMLSLWEQLKALPLIDLTECFEQQDNTSLAQELACAGGVCDLTFERPNP